MEETVIFKTTKIIFIKPTTEMAGAPGLEPRLTDPKTVVLPLDDAPTSIT